MIMAILGLIFPRLTIALLWLFSGWFKGMFEHWIIPLIGFIFLPFTMLWYSVVMHWFGGTWGMWQILILILAVLFDLGAAVKSKK